MHLRSPTQAHAAPFTRQAKNFVHGKEGQSTKVAAAVIELQKRLPRARVLYCSATGVSEVRVLLLAPAAACCMLR